MADVSKIKLPDNTEVNVKDSRISGIDSAPTSGSGNIITSGGVYSALSSYLPLSGGTMANTNLVTNLNADLIDGYNSSEFLPDRILNATSGCLVKTKLEASTNNNHVYFRIEGKSHSSYRTIFTFGSFYYQGSDSTLKYGVAVNAGATISSIAVLIIGGYIYLWFAQPEVYCSLYVTVLAGTSAINRVDTITNAGLPTENVTTSITITPKTVGDNYFFPLTGGTITGNTTIDSAELTIKTSTSGVPTMVFQRGTTSDAYVDCLIKNSSGALVFTRRFSGSDTDHYYMSGIALGPIGTLTNGVSSLTLGASDHQWANVYSKDGTFSGNVAATGTVTGSNIPTYHTGTSDPSSSLGNDGDIYIKLSS